MLVAFAPERCSISLANLAAAGTAYCLPVNFVLYIFCFSTKLDNFYINIFSYHINLYTCFGWVFLGFVASILCGK